jgi:hypothetical protein
MTSCEIRCQTIEYRKLYLTLLPISESSLILKNIKNSDGLVSDDQLENAMKRVEPGEPKNNPPFSAVSG